MTRIALLGDSTTISYQLTARYNPQLVEHHGKTASYDFANHAAILSYIASPSSVEIGNFGRGSLCINQSDHPSALHTIQNYVAGSYGCPVTYRGTAWDAVKSWYPDVLVINFGNNDSVHSTLANFRSGFDTVLSEANSLGYKVVIWNGMWYQFGPVRGPVAIAKTDNETPFLDELSVKAVEYGATLVDTRSLFQASIAAGVWDLWTHNDATYQTIWTSAGTPPEEAYYANSHQWIGGQEIIASAIARSLPVVFATADADSINLSWEAV